MSVPSGLPALMLSASSTPATFTVRISPTVIAPPLPSVMAGLPVGCAFTPSTSTRWPSENCRRSMCSRVSTPSRPSTVSVTVHTSSLVSAVPRVFWVTTYSFCRPENTAVSKAAPPVEVPGRISRTAFNWPGL
ncbi:hypothetical protein D3C76_1291930 [compost metagenome]